MFLASNGTDRVKAFPGGQASCPQCRQPVVPKCGDIVSWHWAHIARQDCDPWAECDTAWHSSWQERVSPDRREVVIGPHRADIVAAADSRIVELQHSPISPREIAEREAFYGKMAWLFDARDAVAKDRLDIRDRGKFVTFRWKHPRKSIGACGKPVLLDIGNDMLLRVKSFHSDAPCGGWGRLVDADGFGKWMDSGGRLVYAPSPPWPAVIDWHDV